MPAAIVPRDEVVRRLFKAFTSYGYEGATLARLSEATGLGRASLYHYFPDGKDAMLREVLALARGWIENAIASPLRDAKKTPARRLRNALDNIAAGYDDGRSSCLVNIAGLGDASSVAGHELRLTADAYVDAFAEFLTGENVAASKAREAALDTVLQIEGGLVMARALGDKAVFLKRLDRIEKMLLAFVR